MALQILGGQAKGFSCDVPKGHHIRPMSIRLKRRLFDAFQDFSDYIFVDLCAGSGAIGIEAWSRGAKQIFLNEKDKKVYSITKSNIKRLKTSYQSPREITMHLGDCLRYLADFQNVYEKLSTEDQKYTVLFFAPPYPLHNLYKEMLKKVQNADWFRGEIWVESDYQKGVKQEFVNEFLGEPYKIYKQGTTFLSLYDLSNRKLT